MNIFTNFKLVTKVLRVINDVKECLNANNDLADQIKEVIAIFATGFDKLKKIRPNIATAIDDIIKTIKKG